MKLEKTYLMNNIEILKKDKVFKKIINDFNIELIEKVTKIKNMNHLLLGKEYSN